MPRFLCLQRSLPGPQPEQPSPAQMQELYARFAAWQEKYKSNLLDLGGRVGDRSLIRPESALDGPLVEVKELVGGYMVVSATSLEEAASIAEQCPGLIRPGSGVEVIEIRSP